MVIVILILPIQEYSISFHRFVSSSVTCISILDFSVFRSFASLGRFMSRYLILFDVMVNGIVSLISLSDISLLVYRNATDFCALVLYPATLLNSLSSSSLLVASLGFSVYSMSSADGDSFTSTFPIRNPFISISSDCCG